MVKETGKKKNQEEKTKREKRRGKWEKMGENE